MRTYDLMPTTSRKSFYGKAQVLENNDGTSYLLSYGTMVVKRNTDGTLVRLWDGWSSTTGNHISSFCGLNKKEFLALPLEN